TGDQSVVRGGPRRRTGRSSDEGAVIAADGLQRCGVAVRRPERVWTEAGLTAGTTIGTLEVLRVPRVLRGESSPVVERSSTARVSGNIRSTESPEWRNDRPRASSPNLESLTPNPGST